jgi:hypothetical protein
MSLAKKKIIKRMIIKKRMMDGWTFKKMSDDYRRWTYKYNSIKINLAICFSTFEPKVTKVLV